MRREAEAAQAASAAAASRPKRTAGKSAAVATTAKPKRRSLVKIEQDIEEAEAEIEQLNAELADSANWRIGDKMRALQERLEGRQAELAGFEAEWEEHAAG